MAKNVIAQLMENGSVSRGWLGVNIQDVTKDLAAGLGMEKPEGALVSSVTDGSPAARGGLQPGDVIVAVNGERIEKMRELPRLIARIAAGSDTKMTVIRGGKERGLTVTIGAMPEEDKIAAVSPDNAGKPRFGMTLAALNDGTRDRRRPERHCRRKGPSSGRRHPAGLRAGSGGPRRCCPYRRESARKCKIRRTESIAGSRESEWQRPLCRPAAARRVTRVGGAQ